MADRFFKNTAGYVAGDFALIDRMARGWNVLGAALELEEFRSPLNALEYIEILKARSGG